MSRRATIILVGTLSIVGIIPALATAADAGKADADSSPLNGSVTADYTSGKYGDVQATRVGSLTTDIDWSVTDSTTLSLSLPFIIQQAPQGTVGGGGHGGANGHRGSNRGANSPVITTSGIGDLVLGIDQDLLDQTASNPVGVGVFAEVQFGTADVAKGLGSGKNDFSFGGRVGHSWDKFHVGGELGYTLVGKPGTVVANGVSTTLDYRNVVFGSINGAYDLNDRTTLGAELSTSQSYERGLASTSTISGDVTYRMTQKLKLKGAVLGGLTNNSPDYGLSLTVAWAF